HLTAEAFDDDRDAVLQRAVEAGVGRAVCIGSNPADAEQALAIAERTPWIWSTAGLHPHEAETADAEGWRRIRALLDRERVVAVGECGLDFHYDFSPRDEQLDAFRRQVAMAGETGLPLVVHCRDADEAMRAELAGAAGEVSGVLHCFTGGDALMDDALAAGWYVSFSGIVTFRRFEGAEQILRVPLDRLLIETDAPYLAPVPRRGRRNEPAYVAHTAAVVARILDRSVDEVAEITARNAARFYGLPAEGASS
ncbi:MAG: TatD family hydrolase, partial [Gemmatimonadetes bacterium]|nr:TatD family hydrolase [Gemmatimonadota bacterium]